jgi:endonuclease G
MNMLVRLSALLMVLAGLAWYGLQAGKGSTEQKPANGSASATHSTSFAGGFPLVANPVLAGSVQQLTNICYHVGYSNMRGNPLWVLYELHRNKDNEVAKRPSKFTMDNETEAKIVHEHYNRSGYDRGHMAPNHAIGALCSDEAQFETFKMSNIIPQAPNLNQKWWERLERVEFNHFTKQFEQVWVITGPVFSANPATLPNGNKVQVPEWNYKIHLAQKAGQWYALAFLVEQGVQGNEPLSQYVSTIAEIEQKTGLSFLSQFPTETQKRLLASKADPIWKLDQVENLPSKY